MRRAAVGAALLVAAVVIAIVAVKTVVVFPRGWIQDDSFFYAQIAYNLGTSGLSSFDGINVTNGYHLLWGWLLAAVSFMAGTVTPSKDVHFVLMVALYMWLVLLASARYGRSTGERALLFSSFFLITVLMETALLSIVVLFVADTCFTSTSSVRRVPLVLAFFLIPLIRIDAAVLGAVAALAFARERRLVGWLWLSLAVGGLTQLALNKILFGEYVSVVTLIKASHPQAVLANLRGNVAGENLVRLASVSCLYLLALVAVASSTDVRHKGGAAAIATGCIVFILFHTALNNIIGPWYYLPCYVVLPYVVLSMARRRSIGRLAYLAAHCALICGYVGLKGVEVYTNHRDGVYGSAMEFTRQVARNVPEGEKAYMIDGSGFVGFFSGRQVINGDGLVNSFEYAAALNRDALGDYLRDHGINYIITNNPLAGPYIVNFHGLRVDRTHADEIVAASHPARFVDFRLFRVRAYR